jgi:hypothetical protein
MASIEMIIQTLDKLYSAAPTLDQTGDIVYDIERVCPFIAYNNNKSEFRDMTYTPAPSKQARDDAPSVHPLSSPAQLPSALRASIKPVASLNSKKGARIARSSKKLVTFSDFPSSPART